MINKHIINALMLAENHPSITKIGIFGSYARNDYNKQSGIDILYDHEMDYDNGFEMFDDMMNALDVIENELTEHFGDREVYFLAYYLLFEDDLCDFQREVGNNILDEVVWIYQKESDFI